jgi:hypothetical protein
MEWAVLMEIIAVSLDKHVSTLTPVAFEISI